MSVMKMERNTVATNATEPAAQAKDDSRPLPRVSVVIPARNEAENLPHVLPQIPSFVHEIILVDGHSTDNTPAVARELLPNIRIIAQEGTGKGDALRRGFAAATGEVIVMLDADGSTDPHEIPLFVHALCDGADYAKGSRKLPGGGSVDISRHRDWGNSLLTLLVNVLFDARFTDLCYGYNAFWRYTLYCFDVDCDGFEVETLLNIRAQLAGLNMREVPSFEKVRLHGSSNLNAARDGWRVLRMILTERFSGHRHVFSAHRLEPRLNRIAETPTQIEQPALSLLFPHASPARVRMPHVRVEVPTSVNTLLRRLRVSLPSHEH